ncbi:MAG: hypothetical protein R3F42_11325 [Pseudomonadota bacterium]
MKKIVLTVMAVLLPPGNGIAAAQNRSATGPVCRRHPSDGPVRTHTDSAIGAAPLGAAAAWACLPGSLDRVH